MATNSQAGSNQGTWITTILLLLATNVGAQPEIHRCVQADGTIAFQEMPCPEPAPARSADYVDAEGDVEPDNDRDDRVEDFVDFVNPFDEQEGPSVSTEPGRETPVSQERATCEKITRDAIDAIDLEMRRGYTEEQGQQYLAELLTLTRQLRACKQL